ncbi:TetR/AcrR family transcriptional regulator [Abyssisolibacter fermentans]|uniref:TetR/AcrR family transcriptional regulator n=1 Tax=Abyssisolibacter fermentans TaxID=1766203 RepID=UPI00082D54BE|nr:TetR/AcrR family transcriptional regulator [Abyssisolibacter fermentans]
MPKDTFFNLNEDKRKRIIDNALEEFAKYDYKTASVSRIVEKAGISKGSMYQYFENKKDLYLYLLDLVSEEKLNHISKSIDPEEKDFFEMYKQLNLIGTQFDLSHIKYSRLLYNAIHETNNDELGDIPSQIMKKSDDFVKNFIYQAQLDGQIRKDVDLELLAFLVSRITIEMADYISHKFDFSYSKIVLEGTGSLPIDEEDIKKVLDDLIKFYKTGLKA